MGKRRIRNTPHAVGDHGPKTARHIIRQLHSAPPKPPAESYIESARSKAAFEGRRRLVEDRQQHDEGEKNSEHKRLFIETRRGRDNEPSDNSGNLHGVLGSREHRADFKERGPDGLVKRRR